MISPLWRGRIRRAFATAADPIVAALLIGLVLAVIFEVFA